MSHVPSPWSTGGVNVSLDAVSLTPPAIVDTRSFFRPVSTDLAAILRDLSVTAWHLPTLAGMWTVRDIVAHLIDLSLRRLSFQRDGLIPPPPPFDIRGERDFVRFINGLNHEWVSAMMRCSPQVLTELFELASADLADFFEGQPLEGPGLFGVSWAGEDVSAGWFDIGREFTELWHHQMQIRLAVGALPLSDTRYLKAVLDIGMRSLPHVFRDMQAGTGETLVIDIEGTAGSTWTLRRDADRWSLWSGRADRTTTQVRLSDDAAWKLLFNALPTREASSAMSVEGDERFARPLITARSIVV